MAIDATLRVAGLWQEDQAGLWRCSHDNPYVEKLHEDFLGEPPGKKSEELLQASHHPRATSWRLTSARGPNGRRSEAADL
ncbi:MAG TPA: iron hydrogenase small subunit [Candidatus Limnocylindrales bacterium]|jgi:hypothetical protein